MKNPIFFLLKTMLLLSLFNSGYSSAGVGGSAGGKGDKRETGTLQYYIDSSKHETSIPTIMFEADNGHRVHLPVTKVCLFDDQTFRTQFEVSIPLYDDSKVFGEKEEYLFVERREIVLKRKLRLFKPTIETYEERLRPLDYKIEIFKISNYKEHEFSLFKKIDFRIKNCD